MESDSNSMLKSFGETKPAVEPSQQHHILSEILQPVKPLGIGLRHIQVIMLFFALFLAYGLRVNMSIGIVAMTDNSSNPKFKQYDWSESIRGILLSSFFWGYIVSQIPASQLAQLYGAKILLTISLGTCSVLTLLTPFAASLGWQYLCVARAGQGLFQGCLFSCVHTMLAHWVHPSERGFLSSFTYSGTQLGTVGMLAISGIIAASPFGWPGIFYISGALTGVWTMLWCWLGCNSPLVSSKISRDEKAFIQAALGCATSDANKRTPWMAIFHSKPFWALLTAHCAHNWGFFTLLMQIPSYMKNVLEFDIKSNALLSAMPYLVMWIVSLSFSKLSDFLTNRSYVSVVTARKLFNSIGLWLPAVVLVLLGYVTKENTTLAVFLLTAAVGINGADLVGYLINHLDLSPNYAGTLMGLTNCASNIMSLLGPLFIGFIVTDAEDPLLWRIAFFVAAGVFFVGNLMFVLFGSATIQSWNTTSEETNRINIECKYEAIDTKDV